MTWERSEHRLVDDATGIEHLLGIDRPFRAVDQPPLLLCLDGAWTAGTVRDATRIMSMSGEAPEAAVAGLWFADTSMSDYLRSRARWFTPTGFVPPPEVGVKNITAVDTGHAEAYQRFVAEQVLPLLAQAAPHSEIWLVGHSFSGLFGLRVLFDQPDLFDRYLLMSPSIWWHGRSILDAEAAWAGDHDDLTAHVFMSVGENEGTDFAGDGPFDMAANLSELAGRLVERSYPSLRLSTAVLPGESHSSTIGGGVSRGLRALFAPDSLTTAADTAVTIHPGPT